MVFFGTTPSNYSRHRKLWSHCSLSPNATDMSRATQHSNLQKRNGTSNYRLFVPEAYSYPERIEALETVLDSELGLMTLKKPQQDENDKGLWLLTCIQAYAEPCTWTRDSPIEEYAATYCLFFGNCGSNTTLELIY